MLSDESYPFLLLILAFIRIMGGVVFLDFYSKSRSKRFLALTIAFALYSLNPLIQLFLPTFDQLNTTPSLYSADSRLLFIFSEVIMTIAVLLFSLVAINYSYPVTKLFAEIGIIGTVVITGILYLVVSFETIFYLTQILDLILILAVIPFFVIYRTQYQRIARNVPLFFALVILVAGSNIILTFFDSELMSTLELLTRVGVSYILPFAYIHLEYNLIALEKTALKDKYSHNLAQHVQLVASRLFLIIKMDKIDEEAKNEMQALESNINDIKDLITLIREL